MAIQTPITTVGATKAPRETAASLGFIKLLQAQIAFVEAERDYEDICYSRDPAYSGWARDAEHADEYLTEAIMAFHDLPIELPEDRPLQRMALLVDAMLSANQPGGARRLHRQMLISFFSRFQVAGIGATAMHRNALLIQARHVASAIAALPLFDSVALPDGDDLSEAEEPVSTF